MRVCACFCVQAFIIMSTAICEGLVFMNKGVRVHVPAHHLPPCNKISLKNMALQKTLYLDCVYMVLQILSCFAGRMGTEFHLFATI